MTAESAPRNRTILLAESRTLLRVGLRQVVQTAGDMVVAGETVDFGGTARGIRDLSPDVVVIGSLTDCVTSVGAVGKLAAKPPASPPRFLALVDTWDLESLEMSEPNVGGLMFTSASAEELLAAIRMLCAGYSFTASAAQHSEPRADQPEQSRTPPAGEMTSREIDVLRLLARGYTNAEISRELSLSESTVKSHVQNVLHKKHLRNRARAVVYAYETGLTKVGENLTTLFP
ncbi:DNA-binding response regulator [Sphaerisporangium melleum]|uniref:DNA-binding response regulator n=1 Tax=Sphaerisporangium melleum TaxID=321316 RepID=A0A917VFD6_9ACTN|nr:response regulator transcription factor [Sphaerisporangium melleum]GGK70188.1 DNA-binding response regulator [Sphaerisporangium melleum]GII70310.1 DNA-binding response regulator [Sphaerisporangium melleum]